MLFFVREDESSARSKLPTDWGRVGLAIISAASSVPFAFLGYRLLLFLPLSIAGYLGITGINGYNFTRSRSSVRWMVRLIAAFSITWFVTLRILGFLHADSVDEPTDEPLCFVPTTILFAAIIYRCPFLPSQGWMRHVLALVGTTVATILLICSLVATMN
jgi:hypothetical protein